MSWLTAGYTCMRYRSYLGVQIMDHGPRSDRGSLVYKNRRLQDPNNAAVCGCGCMVHLYSATSPEAA